MPTRHSPLAILCSPGDLDDQHLVVQGVPHDVSETQLRPDAIFRRAVPDGQLALLVPILDPYVVALDPLAVALQMTVGVGLFGDELVEMRDLALALHVRLADENEDLDGTLAGLVGRRGSAHERTGHGDDNDDDQQFPIWAVHASVPFHRVRLTVDAHQSN